MGYIPCLLVATWLPLLVSAWKYVSTNVTFAEPTMITPSPRHQHAQVYKPIPTFKHRNELGQLLDREGFKIGAELGVQEGRYTEKLLQGWKGVEKYVLVDVWRSQENYKDIANVPNDKQEEYFRTTQNYIKPWTDKIEVCRNWTTVCVNFFPRAFFDFVYVDARHDRLGVLDDLRDWWPKVKRHGLMCGHDYEEQEDGPKSTNQRWDVNYDGTIDTTGRVVRGAVDDFAANVSRQVQVSYREGNWNSWCIRK
jgi:hypothetical protein